MSEAVDKTKGWFQKQKDLIPVTSKVIAIILLVLNIFFPGVGTLIMACVGGQFMCEHIICGVLQILLAFIIIGWVWSIVWGVFLLLRAN